MKTSPIKNFAKRFGVLYDVAHKSYTYLLGFRRSIYEYRHRERTCSYGTKNPDKIFYVIGVNHTTAGLFAIVKSVFCHIYYAIENGYIPVVDMHDFKSQLSLESTKTNAWEIFFEQPCGYSLTDISNCKNIIRSASLPYPKGVEIGFDTDIDEAFYARYHDAFKKYIRPSDAVRRYSLDKFDLIFKGKGRVLGVLCRGTDYIENHPIGHPIQPSIGEALQRVLSQFEDPEYNYVFLATEDKKYYDEFKETFKDKLLFSGQKLYKGMNGKQYLSEIPVADDMEKWHNIVDYYSTIYMLSRCDGLVAGLTCGSICAYLMSDSYEDVYFWNLGKYV